MVFDSSNKIVQLCAEGMEMEGQGNPEGAAMHFNRAWTDASSDFEKFIAAHYLARHQPTVADKLRWDLTALQHALLAGETQAALPSLYLNIAKGYEDLNEVAKAITHYRLAVASTKHLSDDGYSVMIKKGIANGLERLGISE